MAQFCVQCDHIRLTFSRGGLFGADATYLEFLQDGETVLIRKLDFIPKGDLTIGVCAFVPVESQDIRVSDRRPKD